MDVENTAAQTCRLASCCISCEDIAHINQTFSRNNLKSSPCFISPAVDRVNMHQHPGDVDTPGVVWCLLIVVLN